MTKDRSEYTNKMLGTAQFALFLTSYSPLFLLIGLKQVYENRCYLHWGGITFESLHLFVANFYIAIIAFALSIIGVIGTFLLFDKIATDAANGSNVVINKISNKNSESIGYIATYIVPFLFQSFDNWYAIFALIFLLAIIYRIYINSNLLLINPVLNFKYAIYEVEYIEQSGKIRNGMIITKSNNIQEDSTVKLYEIGFKLFFAIKRNK